MSPWFYEKKSPLLPWESLSKLRLTMAQHTLPQNDLKNFSICGGVKHNTGIPHSPMGQLIVERAQQTIKWVLNQQQRWRETSSPIERLCKALYTINFLKSSFSEPTPAMLRHFSNLTQAKLNATCADKGAWNSPNNRPLSFWNLGQRLCL